MKAPAHFLAQGRDPAHHDEGDDQGSAYCEHHQGPARLPAAQEVAVDEQLHAGEKNAGGADD